MHVRRIQCPLLDFLARESLISRSRTLFSSSFWCSFTFRSKTPRWHKQRYFPSIAEAESKLRSSRQGSGSDTSGSPCGECAGPSYRVPVKPCRGKFLSKKKIIAKTVIYIINFQFSPEINNFISKQDLIELLAFYKFRLLICKFFLQMYFHEE